MKMFLATILMLVSLTVFADYRAEDLHGVTVTGSSNIFEMLKAKIEGLENPNCVAFGVRKSDDNLDLRYASGQYIYSISFIRKIIVISEDRAIDVLNVSLSFNTPEGEEAGTTSFNCRIKH